MNEQRPSEGSESTGDKAGERPQDRKKSGGVASTEELRLLMRMTGLAFQFGTEIIAGVLLGWGFDKLFGTQPWGILIGTLAGIAVATLDLIRKAIQMNRQMDAMPRSSLDLAGKRTAAKPKATGPQSAAAEQKAHEKAHDKDENNLGHEQWKSATDEELSPNDRNDSHDQADGKPKREG